MTLSRVVMSGHDMTPDPRIRAELNKAAPSWDTNPADHATSFFSVEESTEEPNHVTQVARTLAAHGGGAVSVDLAFDLVLNEVVEQARKASGATGGAIALFRDGELVCRATTGENAPDLGVRVETVASLAGACVTTGEIQQCRDTETDPRVNAEACLRLGVRSMLIAPLVDSEKVIGILQVFSSWPNAFGKREISALQVLAGRIAESNREAQAGIATADAVPATPHVQENELPDNQEPGAEMEGPSFGYEQKFRGTEIWTSILVVLVIAAAVLLGVMIGWRRAARGTSGAPPAQTVVAPPAQTASQSEVETQAAPQAGDSSETSKALPASKTPTAADAVPPPSGGLVVTQNGKVIYRSPSPPSANSVAATPKPSTNRLIHRVEPEYPAEARAQRVQGPVVLDVQVLGNGTVGNIAVVSGDPLLSEAALQAVKQWRYRPYFVDGKAVESETRITIRFTLPPS